jgi:hypothetical protein
MKQTAKCMAKALMLALQPLRIHKRCYLAVVVYLGIRLPRSVLVGVMWRVKEKSAASLTKGIESL